MFLMKIKRYCFALDLKDEEALISEYVHYHQPDVIWPEIIEGIKKCNIIDMEIYRIGNRLCMILETNEVFQLERDFAKMLELPAQKEWADLMKQFQQRLPFSGIDEGWAQMNKIFKLNSQPHKYNY